MKKPDAEEVIEFLGYVFTRGFWVFIGYLIGIHAAHGAIL